MKTRKIETYAFPISERKERQLAGKLKNNLQARILGQKTKIEKGYLPLAAYRLTRKVPEKGGYKTAENSFYIDLHEGDIYFMRGKDVVKYDILRRVIDLPGETVSLFGELMQSGSALKEELDKGAVDQLWGRRLVHVSRDSKKVIAALLIDELSANPTGRKTETKEHVKAVYPLPGFVDPGFNLQNHLQTTKEAAEDYDRRGIRYPTDTVGKTLERLFACEADLTGLIYMPYLKAKTSGKTKKESEPCYPLPGNPWEKTKKGEKIKQLALSTEIGSEDTVPTMAETIDFSCVCGMLEVKKEIKNLLIKPLRDPKKARRIKKSTGGSLLLYGPPGCGKTYIAKAAVGETGFSFFNVNLSDISRLGSEDAAKAIHRVFLEAARHTPSMVFFDELDSLASKRTEGQDGKEKTAVTQLLVELDGAESLMENVLVIGATNAPWNLDPALRRSGRFTRQIYVGPPDEKTRCELFKKHLKELPKAGIEPHALAQKTEGYSCSDIKAICDLAGQALWDKESLSQEDLLDATEKQDSTLTAWYRLAEKEIRKSNETDIYREMAESILREAGGLEEAEKPALRFIDVGGMTEVKEEIRKSIIYPIENPELAKRYGKQTGGALLLYGPPGCGKTYMAKATAGECNASFYNVDLSDIMCDGAETRIREIFERAKRNTPAVVFFDELDSVAPRREDALGEERKLINQMLIELDGFREKKDLLIIGATNAPWNLDPAVRRTGRFSKQILIAPPDRETRKEIFRVHTQGKPLGDKVDLGDLADITQGYSCSDIKAICDLAAEIPWDEALSGGAVRDIRTEDFLRAIEEQQPSILPWLNSAMDSLKSSKEAGLYEELYSLIEGFFKDEEEALEAEIVDQDDCGEEDMMFSERFELEDKIELARKRYMEGVIDREDFKLIMMHYQKKLVDLELRMHGEEEKEEENAPMGGAMPHQGFPSCSPGDEGLMWMKDFEWTVGTHPSGRLHYRIRSMRGDVFKS